MKKSIFIINYIMLAILVALTVCYAVYGGLHVKAMTSFTFVLVGSINLIYVKINNPKKLKLAGIMLIGMIFGMCGDVFINLEFIPGAAAFALGHIFYWIAYNYEDRIRAKDIVAVLALAMPTAAFLFLTPIFDFESTIFSVVIFAYCIIISMMTSKAIMNAKRRATITNKIWAVGSIMFFFSDVMLVLDMFADTPRITIILCLLTYFPAQWVLGHGIFCLAYEK